MAKIPDFCEFFFIREFSWKRSSHILGTLIFVASVSMLYFRFIGFLSVCLFSGTSGLLVLPVSDTSGFLVLPVYLWVISGSHLVKAGYFRYNLVTSGFLSGYFRSIFGSLWNKTRAWSSFDESLQHCNYLQNFKFLHSTCKYVHARA